MSTSKVLDVARKRDPSKVKGERPVRHGKRYVKPSRLKEAWQKKKTGK